MFIIKHHKEDVVVEGWKIDQTHKKRSLDDSSFPFLGLVAGLFNPAVAAQLTAFVLRLQGIQRGYLILDGVDAVTPRLVLGVQRIGLVGQWLACCLCLGVLDGLVIVAAKLRFQRVALAVESVLLLDDF